MKLILNDTLSNHRRFLEHQFKTADQIRISVAYLKSTGLSLLLSQLKSALRRGAKIEIFCGLDFHLTDPAALHEVFALTAKAKRITCYLCKLPKDNFHPKFYCFWSNHKVTAVVGSANWSKGGLERNI